MGRETDIAWCDSTINPTSGCCGCELWSPKMQRPMCYAAELHETRLAKAHPTLYAPSFGSVQTIPGRMQQAASWSDLRGKDRPDKPWLNRMPRMIFMGDMGDLLAPQVPWSCWDREILPAIRSKNGQRHIWLLLTKQSKRLVELGRMLWERSAKAYSEPVNDNTFRCGWPTNLWAGVSVTSQATAVRINDLRKCTGPRVRFISFEPLLERVDPVAAMEPADQDFDYVDADPDAAQPEQFVDGEEATGDWQDAGTTVENPEWREHQQWRHRAARWQALKSAADWWIIGGSSGRNAKPFDIGWMRELNRQAKGDVAVFNKQLGAMPLEACDVGGCRGDVNLVLKHRAGADWNEWPADLRVRHLPEEPW